MPLHDLDVDVIIHILSLADIYTILSAFRLNKAFHALTRSRPLWISVIRNLSHSGLIDIPIETLSEIVSTDNLIREVKRAVLGPVTWSISRQIVIPVADGWSGESLLGGTHVVLRLRAVNSATTVLKCRDLYNDRTVWEWQGAGHCYDKMVFDTFLSQPKAVAGLVFPTQHLQQYNIQILEADMETGGCRVLMELPLNSFHPILSDICGAGDYKLADS
ncbi:hypothetical protein C8F04DRAFT_379668 [Mycena alexandri]|uniref:F-box domain-containing protein n=1 Tax=Mycena alexandri TaxID=1745969 RepID=A0AAD6S0W0_9AGAR|nr:hypothetical protein C8F04DRAFT_379668 [Mycena alexandri]